MNAAPEPTVLARECLDAHPEVNVSEVEYRRLLGYPPDHVPGERARELAATARQWYGVHGRPWVYQREVEVTLTPDRLWLDGGEFSSPELHRHLRTAVARRAVLVAVSAGRACEEQARALWQEAKPDEYFFLEVFGSAVVEHLVAVTAGRVCDRAERDGLVALPHYSPGYTGWNVADQPSLFALIARGATPSWPESLEVLASGMLRPKKSLLAVIGLTDRPAGAVTTLRSTPCEACAFAPCQYRRAPYRHAAAAGTTGVAPVAPLAGYSINRRALRKWARERVSVARQPDGRLAATFRFDGTTCSNLGQTLAFDYVVTLAPDGTDYTILEADCRPADGDEGHRAMCAYLADAPALMQAIAAEKPLLGRRLGDVFAWQRPAGSTGCHCDTNSRAHKWGLALESIHFALANVPPVSRIP